jgi:hypothetical protein
LNNSISKDLGKEIVNKGFDTSIDYAEMFLDSITESEALKGIPLVKTVVASVNIFNSIRDKVNLKKLLVFLKEFHSKEISDENFQKFEEKFRNNPKFKEMIIEHILVFIDRINGTEKSKILGRLFGNHIQGKIDWNRFIALSICLENIHPNSFAFLEKLSKQDWIVREAAYTSRDHEKEGLLSAAGISFTHGNFFTVNQLGRDLFEFGIKEYCPPTTDAA